VHKPGSIAARFLGCKAFLGAELWAAQIEDGIQGKAPKESNQHISSLKESVQAKDAAT
jgi:hypothetical protein